MCARFSRSVLWQSQGKASGKNRPRSSIVVEWKSHNRTIAPVVKPTLRKRGQRWKRKGGIGGKRAKTTKTTNQRPHDIDIVKDQGAKQQKQKK